MGATTAPVIRISIIDSTCACTSLSNRSFDCKQLLREIKRRTATQHYTRPNPTAYRKEAFTVIRRHLDSTGYFDARWDSAGPQPASITPGNRTVIRNERFLLRRPPSPDSLSTPLPPADYPRLFDAAIVRTRAETVCSSYTRSGYPFAAVTADFKPAGLRDTIELVFTIDPDEMYRFAAPLLRGSFSTKSKILLRDLSIVPDSLFDERMVAQSIERLRTRNYIAAAVAHAPVITARAASGKIFKQRITVPFAITDRAGMGLEGAAGLEAGGDDKPRFQGNARFAFTNLFHAGEEAALAYAGDKTRQRLDIEYSQPWLFGLPFTGDIGGGLEVVSGSYGYLFGSAGLYYEPAVRWHAGLIISGNNVSRTSPSVDGGAGSGTFGGGDLALIRSPEPYRNGTWSRELAIVTGSGITRKERMYSRSHIDFMAGVHLPMPFRTALVLRGGSGHIVTRENNLVAAELYRIGSGIPLRGYMENEFAFKTVVYAQSELLYYFQQTAPVYLFFDGGMGFEGDIGSDRSHRNLGGYGLGIRLPAGIGSLSIEWGRNIDDARTPGRLHVRFRNSFSSADKILLPVSRK